MGTKNLNENGPNPFFFFGTKNTVRVYLMATYFGMISTISLSLSMRGRYKMKLSNGNGHLFFKRG